MRLRSHTDAEERSCHLDGSGAIVLQMFEEIRVNVTFLKFGTVENLPVQRNGCLYTLQDEHIQGPIHSPYCLIARGSVHDELRNQ